MEPGDFNKERAHRAGLLASLLGVDSTLAQVPTKAIHALGVFAGGRGTYAPPVYDDLQTSRQRITLSLLHTGRHYADALSDESLIYHFPATKLTGYDVSDVDAGKAAMQLRLPVFVILSPVAKSPAREVRVGHVLGVDDQSKQFLIGFSGQPTDPQPPGGLAEDIAFSATVEEVKKKRRSSIVRANDQPRFAFNVLKRYGPKCAFCSVRISSLLDAAHIVSVAQYGSDDARNGLALCRNHHAAFDAGMIAIDDDRYSILVREGISVDELGITETSVTTATGQVPHVEAVRWRNQLARAPLPSPS